MWETEKPPSPTQHSWGASSWSHAVGKCLSQQSKVLPLRPGELGLPEGTLCSLGHLLFTFPSQPLTPTHQQGLKPRPLDSGVKLHPSLKLRLTWGLSEKQVKFQQPHGSSHSEPMPSLGRWSSVALASSHTCCWIAWGFYPSLCQSENHRKQHSTYWCAACAMQASTLSPHCVYRSRRL